MSQGVSSPRRPWYERYWWLIASLIFVLWIATPLIDQLVLTTIGDAKQHGMVGDLFGSTNALFSGLALGGMVIAVLMQKEELSLQRKELAQQIEETKRIASAQEESSSRLKESLEQEKEFWRKRLTIEVANEWASSEFTYPRLVFSTVIARLMGTGLHNYRTIGDVLENAPSVLGQAASTSWRRAIAYLIKCKRLEESGDIDRALLKRLLSTHFDLGLLSIPMVKSKGLFDDSSIEAVEYLDLLLHYPISTQSGAGES